MIKQLIKDWYKELFWMGVGAAISLAAVKAIKSVRVSRTDPETEKEIKNVIPPCPAKDEEEIEENIPNPISAEPEEEQSFSSEEFTAISEDEFYEFSSYSGTPDTSNRFELIYDPERDLFAYLDRDWDLETMHLDDQEIREMIGEKIANEAKRFMKYFEVICGSIKSGDVYIRIVRASICVDG